MDQPRHGLAPPYGSRPIVVGLTLLALAGLGAFAWMALEHDASLSPTAVVNSRTDVGAASNQAEETPAAPAVVVSSAERDTGLVDVCGLGWVEASADSTFPDRAVFAQVPGTDASADVIVAGLRDSGDAFDRAVALMLGMQRTEIGSTDPALLEQLAQQAVTTDDPRVYALAFRICARSPEQGSCARLSAAQWARVDNGNAAPWLFVLDDAAKRNDRALADEALYRIGSAARYEDRPLAPGASIAAHAGTSASDLVAAQALATQALGTAAAFSVPLQRLMRACADTALADANRSQSCDAAAATLGERSDSALIGTIGASLGRRVGWSLDRLVAIRVQSVALAELWASVPGADRRSGFWYSCDGVRRKLDRISQIGRVGEPQAARAWMATSGKPYEAYEQVAREQEASRNAPDADDAARRATPVLRAASLPK